MIARVLAVLPILTVLALPGAAEAFSFGSFDPGDQIASINLGATGSTPLVQNSSTGTMTFSAEVTTITLTDSTVFNVDSGEVIFASTIMLQGGTAAFSPNPFPTFLSGEYLNGVTVDFSITDVADGSNVLMEAEYQDALIWTAQQIFFGVVNGTLDGAFDVVGGDSAFTSAFASAGELNAQMSSFLSNGLGVNQACELTTSGGVSNQSCFGTAADGFDNWTSNPTVTIVPTVPEPSATALLLGGLLGFAAVLRRAT